jgi:hypothetical protein
MHQGSAPSRRFSVAAAAGSSSTGRIRGCRSSEAELLARRHNWPRAIVTITNDNLPALYFYQRRGYRLSAILRDSIAAHTRDEKAVGFAGIPILDEIQLAKEL